MKRRLFAFCYLALALIVAGFPCPSGQAADSPAGFADKYAVLIGVDSHSDPALNTAVEIDDGADKMRDALLGRNFAGDHILLLSDRDATRQAIISAVGSSFLGKVCGKDDLAFVFIGTQCFPAIDGKTYLLPYDTRLPNFYASAIDTDYLLELIKKNVKAKEVVIVFSTSFTGAPEMISGCKTKFGQYNTSIERLQLPPNYTVIASSKSSQPTWGIYFAENLARAISTQGPNASLSDVFSRTRTETINDTTKDCAGCKLQSPVMASKSKPQSIAIGVKPGQPKSTLPAEVVQYIKAQGIYSKCREVVDDFENLVRVQKSNAGSARGASPDDTAGEQRSTSVPATGTAGGAPLPDGGSGTPAGSTSDAAASAIVTDARALSARLDDHIKLMSDYLKENPNFAAGHYILGRLYEYRSDFAGARKEYKEAVKLEPDNSMYYTWVARIMDRFGSDPIAQWKAAYDADRRNLGAIDSLASKAVEDGDIDKAIGLISEGLRIYPGDAGLHVRMSFVQKRKGDLKAAIDHAQEAVFLDSDSFDALVNLGILLMANKDEKGAHAAFRQALELGSIDVDDYYFLSGALEKTSDPGGAIEALERFVNAPENVNDVRVDDAKKRLSKLKTPLNAQ